MASTLYIQDSYNFSSSQIVENYSKYIANKVKLKISGNISEKDRIAQSFYEERKSFFQVMEHIDNVEFEGNDSFRPKGFFDRFRHTESELKYEKVLLFSQRFNSLVYSFYDYHSGVRREYRKANFGLYDYSERINSDLIRKFLLISYKLILYLSSYYFKENKDKYKLVQDFVGNKLPIIFGASNISSIGRDKFSNKTFFDLMSYICNFWEQVDINVRGFGILKSNRDLISQDSTPYLWLIAASLQKSSFFSRNVKFSLSVLIYCELLSSIFSWSILAFLSYQYTYKNKSAYTDENDPIRGCNQRSFQHTSTILIA